MAKGNSQYVQNLIDQSKLGRKNAFIELCQMNYQTIFSFALVAFVEEDEANRLTKKIFVSAWENIKDIRKEIPFNVWIRGIAVFKFMEIYREKDNEFQNFKRRDTKTYYTDEYPILSLFFTFSLKERLMYLFKEVENYSFDEVADIFGGIEASEVRETIRKIRWILTEGIKIE